MALFDGTEDFFSIELGKTIHLPIQFISGQSNAHSALLKNLAKQMKKTGKNFLPVIVKFLENDHYEAIHNVQVLEAARISELNFLWCIVVDDVMLTQILVESGQLIRVPLLSATEEDIAEVLEYLKETDKSRLRSLNPQKTAQEIINQRTEGKLNNLKFLINKKCGVGKATLSKIEAFLPFES